MRKEYGNIRELVAKRLSKETQLPSQNLIDEFKDVKSRGYLKRSEFLKICDWKSSRPRRLYQLNNHHTIRRVSEEVFATKDEGRKIELLTSLSGVRIPVGSAILTMTDPANYGILDIRVWQLLYLYNNVTANPSGQGFSVQNWHDYLKNIRNLAQEFQTEAYRIETILFEHHREIQEGNLYK